MVASSSNLLLVAASSRQGQVRRGSTKPTDHDRTSERENRRGYLIGSTHTNNISGISGTNNLMDNMIMLETVAAPMAFASASAASTSTSTTPPSATKSEEKPRPRPRRKKMASTGVDAMMKKMIVTSSSVVVALPESPTRKQERAGEQRDDLESVFNTIRSASNRKVLAFDLSVPSMPDMIVSMPALPTPTMNQSSSKQKNAMSHSNNDNAPMKKKKKQLQMGRHLRQIKKRLSLTKSKTSSSSKPEEKEEVCLSPGTTSATTSTSSFGPTSQEEEEEDDDASIFDMLTMMTTTLQPRVRSIFPEEEERMPIMPEHVVLPAPPCPLSTTATATATTHEEERVVVVTTSFPSKLDKALSVFSPNDDDDDDGDDDVEADDETDEWGIIASDENTDDESNDQTHNNDHHHSKPFSSRSSFTKHTSHPCFPPRAHLPVVFAAATAAGAE